MKTNFLVISGVFVMSFFMLSSFKTPVRVNQSQFLVQEDIVALGTYDGYEDYGYNFIVLNDDDIETTLTFQKVEESVLKSFDLDSDKLLNKKFKITYKIDIEESIDEDGTKYDDEINTIVKLEKL